MNKKSGRQISIRIDPDIIDRIDVKAAEENRSRNNWIETALIKALQEKE